MKTEILERCLRLLDRELFATPAGIKAMVVNANKLTNDYIKPFREELDQNLLIKSGLSDKNDLIIYYISKFIRLRVNLPEFVTIVDKFPDVFYEKRYKSFSGQWDENDQFSVNRHYFYALLFNQIQACCFNYKIHFLKICRDLDFDLKTIDFENSSEHPEWEDAPVSKKLNETQLFSEIKPIFTPENIPQIFDVLKDYFSPEDQAEFLTILQTGNNSKIPLLFRDSGNRLADAFKQLYDGNIILGCQKNDLENWIQKNFNFRYQGRIKSFTRTYLKEIISTKKDDKCQKPILDLRKDKETGKNLITKL